MGQWTLQLGSRMLIVLSLKASGGGAGPVEGTITHSNHFQRVDAVSFSNMQGPTTPSR